MNTKEGEEGGGEIEVKKKVGKNRERERVRKIQGDEGGAESEEKRKQGKKTERRPIMLK